MRTGRARGFTYLAVLWLLAVLAAGSGVAAQRMTTAVQRERETEMRFRAQEIVRAIERYHARTPAGKPSWPAGLDDLVEDVRHDPPLRHLRRLYDDPFTGRADWRPLRLAGGGLVGVRSRSERPALQLAATVAATRRSGDLLRVGDWTFVAEVAARDNIVEEEHR
jgi:type II secretory pathway pseudopilin PulG